MRKKLTLLLIAAMTAGLLYACTPAATTPPPSAPPAETPTTAPTAKPTAAPTAPPANLAAPSLQRNRPDEYAYMWFRNGTTGSGSKELYVKTGRYGFGFDPDAFSFTKLGLSAPDASYDGDLTAAGDAVAAMAGASSALTIFRNGAAHSALRTTDDYNGGYRNLSIITMGQVCQSFYVNNIPYDGLDSLNARVEINAFCDYFTVYWDVVSRTELTDLRCEYEFNTGDASLTEAKWYDDDPASGILSLSNAAGSRVITFVSP
ncbi:MAG: hypothetical protein KIG36_00440, partial [Eubacteriales bacterium]|nr:hypothetical protein [Eubacteriales bacterium]